MDEIDQTEWDKAWKAMPHRSVLREHGIDWDRLTNHDVGEVIDVTFVEVPDRFRGQLYIAISTCVVCSQSAADDPERIEVSIYPRFTAFPNVGFGPLAYKTCAERCPEIEGPNPIPW